DPPARISLADGLIAVLVFFVLQGLLTMAMLFAGSSPGWSLLVAFVLAGDLVVFFTLYTFWRQKVPDLLTQIGLRREEQGRPLLFSIRTGVAGGAIAALIGGVYLKAIETFEPLRVLWQDTFRFSDLDLVRSGWFLALAVIAAPIFEEYLFRGLVYRGLRRSTGPLLSILGSAAVFAIVHPPIAVLPVFVMGCMAALSFEKTGLLLSPIVVHMVYNFAVVGLANL
ncbi:MAG TPA: type II CAAX endopeptidase family protein, partial [Vicinamibacteria bacterium]|nr:type II CAAX endopeptidase family protein [Vicinamibacteria bacterium]